MEEIILKSEITISSFDNPRYFHADYGTKIIKSDNGFIEAVYDGDNGQRLSAPIGYCNDRTYEGYITDYADVVAMKVWEIALKQKNVPPTGLEPVVF